MTKRLFISKNASELRELTSFLNKKGVELIAYSFLDFRAREFNLPLDFDVIFFGSPRAVQFFLDQHEIPENKQVAAVGEATAKRLKLEGYNVDYFGEGSSIIEVANQFKIWSGSQRILFPASNLSLKTISSRFPEEQKIELVIYDTIIKREKITPAEIYVFTSPSNVEGFFGENQIETGSTIVAWGESTENKLKSVNNPPNHVLSLPTQEELCNLLEQIL